MIRKLTILAAAVALLGGYAHAQNAPTATVSVEKRQAGGTKTERLTLQGKITKIDAATREISIKGGGGNEMTLVAGPQVKNFAQLKEGDIVTLNVTRSLALDLKKGGKAPVERTDVAVAGSAKPGAQPAGGVGQAVQVTANVLAVDMEKGFVTLKGPQRTVDLYVQDKNMLKNVAVGDQVEATYTEAMVISANSAPAKKAK